MGTREDELSTTFNKLFPLIFSYFDDEYRNFIAGKTMFRDILLNHNLYSMLNPIYEVLTKSWESLNTISKIEDYVTHPSRQLISRRKFIY